LSQKFKDVTDATSLDLRLWYVIKTKPGTEHRVEINLSNQGIETFLPLFESRQYNQGRMLQKIKPLFPNYLFAKLDLDLHPVTPGCLGLQAGEK